MPNTYSSSEAFREQSLQGARVEVTETHAVECAPGGEKIIAANSTPDGEEGTCERRLNARELARGNQERQTDAHVLQHVAVPCEHDLFPPIAGLREPIV